MNIKKPLLIAGVTGSVAFASLTGAGAASAATNAQSGSDSLVAKIAQKFSLKEADVKEVFEEEKASRDTERKTANEERLTQAVTDGKITDEQKKKILAKQEELQANRESDREAMKDKTAEERRTAMETKRAELEKWAEENNIPVEYMHSGKGAGGHGPRAESS